MLGSCLTGREYRRRTYQTVLDHCSVSSMKCEKGTSSFINLKSFNYNIEHVIETLVTSWKVVSTLLEKND